MDKESVPNAAESPSPLQLSPNKVSECQIADTEASSNSRNMEEQGFMHDDIVKSSELLKGLNGIKNCVFRPSPFTYSSICGGQLQTLFTQPKEWAWKCMHRRYQYDKREVF